MSERITDRRRTTGERRDRRRAVFVAAVKQAVGAEVSLALARNLGEEGMELRRVPGRALSPSTPLSLAFELPDGGDVVHVIGAVVFERADGRYRTTGIRFEGLSPIDRARIARFVDAQLA